MYVCMHVCVNVKLSVFHIYRMTFHVCNSFKNMSPSTNKLFVVFSWQELQQRREQELTGLQEQLADLTSKLELLDLNMKKYTASMGQMGELQTQGANKNKEEEEAYKVKKKTFDLLPNADENIAKLKVSCMVMCTFAVHMCE